MEVHKPWYDENDADCVFFGSVNLYAGGGFYPGSGSGEDDDREEWPNIINVKLDPVGSGSYILNFANVFRCSYDFFV